MAPTRRCFHGPSHLKQHQSLYCITQLAPSIWFIEFWLIRQYNPPSNFKCTEMWVDSSHTPHDIPLCALALKSTFPHNSALGAQTHLHSRHITYWAHTNVETHLHRSWSMAGKQSSSTWIFIQTHIPTCLCNRPHFHDIHLYTFWIDQKIWLAFSIMSYGKT